MAWQMGKIHHLWLNMEYHVWVSIIASGWVSVNPSQSTHLLSSSFMGTRVTTADSLPPTLSILRILTYRSNAI